MDVGDLNEEEMKKFSKLLDEIAPPEDGMDSTKVQTHLSEDTRLTDQMEELIRNMENSKLLLMDFSGNVTERSQYIEDCEWGNRVQDALNKQQEIMEILHDLKENLEDYYG